LKRSCGSEQERCGDLPRGAMSDSRQDQFSALYGWACPLIVAYALRRTSSREDAADIVAETFEIAWRRFDDIPTGRVALLWLYVTARYVLANHGRRTRRREAIVVLFAEELEGVQTHIAPMDEDALVMRSCLRSLLTDDREVLMLAGWEGLSASEIGRVLGCSPTAARIRLHRARSRLKDEMAGRTAQRKRSGSARHKQGGIVYENSPPEEVFEQ
jgi:RNA polymerase sigma factor (sigma-70 family)